MGEPRPAALGVPSRRARPALARNTRHRTERQRLNRDCQRPVVSTRNGGASTAPEGVAVGQWHRGSGDGRTARPQGGARRLRGVGLWLLALVCTSVQPARAAEQGFALNRFEPAEGDSDWFAMQSLDLRGHGRWATGIVGDWSHRPLVLYDAQGNEVQALLRDQLYAYLGASVVLWDRVRVGASFPLVLMSDGDAAQPGAPTLPVSSGTNVGDLRLGADVRVFGEHRSY